MNVISSNYFVGKIQGNRSIRFLETAWIWTSLACYSAFLSKIDPKRNEIVMNKKAVDEFFLNLALKESNQYSIQCLSFKFIETL